MRARFSLAACLVALWVVSCLAAEPKAKPVGENSFKAITIRLASAKVTVEVDKQPPDQVFELIRKAGSVNIVISPTAQAALADKTVTMKLDGVSALSAFHHLLRYLDVCASYADEALVVTAPKTVEPPPQVTIYDIRDLVEAPRGWRLPPTLFGSQLDPLFYYYYHHDQYAAIGGTRTFRGFMDDLEYLDRYPADPIGEIIAETMSRQLKAEERGISVTYRDGYLIVVEQPKPARISPGAGDIKDALVPASK